MKKTLTLLGMALLPGAVMAQITLGSTGYTSWTPGIDTVHDLTTPVALTNGTNTHWDISASTYAPTPWLLTYNAGTDLAFPDATFHNTVYYPVGPGLNYAVDLWTGITAVGIAVYGEKIAHQKIDLSAMPGMSVGDSLVFIEQTINYSAPNYLLTFPATANANWTSEYSYSTDFNAWIASMSLSNTPGQRVTHVTQLDTVTGWGTVVLKDENGIMTDSIDVLEVKTHVLVSDSFYIMGMPVPDAQLAALGLSQGMESEEFTKKYYRIGEVTPLIATYYNDATFATPTRTEVHTDRLPLVLSVKSLSKKVAVTVYPNPVNGRTINVQVPNNGNWKYMMMNTAGQVVSASDLNADRKINLDASLAAGTYFLKVFNQQNEGAVKTIVVQ